jgi:hypothetical protein
MFKNKTARVTAFIGALGASAALIGTAATTTGAYFTDTEAGTISGKTGTLQVNKVGNYDLSFNELVPGEYQDKNVEYTTTSSSNEDIWLAFPKGAEYGAPADSAGSATLR